MNGVTYVVDSGNTKIMGSKRVDATYASIESTCPDSCSLKGKGCYAMLSFVGIQSRHLDKQATNLTAVQVAKAEANVIDSCYNGGEVPRGRPLRLHVSGDSRTITGTKMINAAIGRWKKRGGGDCWSYTHAWKQVPRKNWNNVSILASVSSVKEVADAKRQGYAPTIVVPEFENDKSFKLDGSDITWIPCPAQTRNVGCSDCKLCFNASRLERDNYGIAFAAHGIMKNSIKKQLKVLK